MGGDILTAPLGFLGLKKKSIKLKGIPQTECGTNLSWDFCVLLSTDIYVLFIYEYLKVCRQRIIDIFMKKLGVIIAARAFTPFFPEFLICVTQFTSFLFYRGIVYIVLYKVQSLSKIYIFKKNITIMYKLLTAIILCM